jgi:hypothetical protein
MVEVSEVTDKNIGHPTLLFSLTILNHLLKTKLLLMTYHIRKYSANKF